jgi:hypothetical protein
MGGGLAGTTALDRSRVNCDLRTIVQAMKQIEDDAFPEDWIVWGKLWIGSGVLRLGDPTKLAEAVRIEGIPPDVYTFYARMARRSSEFGPVLDGARLRIRPGSIDARVALGTIPLRFPGCLLGIAVALDERVYNEQWNTVRHCEEIVRRLLRYPWRIGIAVALDERGYKEQWNTVRHCEEIVRRLLSRRPGNVLDREAYGAKVLAIVAPLIPIDLSEGIDLDTLHDVLSAAMSQERIGVDDYDDVAEATEQLYGAGELRGIEFRFGIPLILHEKRDTSPHLTCDIGATS